MGKASKWFRGLLGLKSPSSTAGSALKPPKEKRLWSFVKSYREKEKDNHHATATPTKAKNRHHATPSYGDLPVHSSGHVEGADPEKQAMAVAAATTAVAEAAVAAAHAAAAVVRLTSSGRCAAPTVENGGITLQEWAAVKIQAAFRGSLARKALRALKGLVKLQALVRGHIERKRTAEWLQRMQALLRAQARVRAGGAQILHNSYWSAKSSAAHLRGPATPDKFESPIRSESMKYDRSSLLKRNWSKSRSQINGNGNQEKCGNRSDSRADEQSRNQRRSWMRTRSMDDERSVGILEIDSVKPNITSKCRSLFYSTGHALFSDHYSHGLSTTKDSTVCYQSGHQSPSSCEVQSYNPLKTNEVEESPICTSDNSPRLLSSSSKDDGSKGSPFTPTRSDGSRSGYCDYPSYMAYTESSKAKVRSLSAPKQRPQQYERCSSSTNYNRYLVHGFGESRLGTHRVSAALQARFTSKAYPGSGRLDKLGMPAAVGYGY